ncbi:hypothetical protein FNH22_01720 [Fulvivirga sp. M361]|uniref:hypothetical protein n=1 Tax=Fulvivirga sp. M361 TaxID=2594266 RepID=UPI00117A6FF5|nr:hypothetical protein [Fulvivirga sp. M361]TRX62063.1 hypothetical protein FNH22_01720 [Fulvivirga sp. M361]
MDKKNQFNLDIITLHCYRQDERKADEIFICYQGKKIWPSDKKYKKITVGKHTLNFRIPQIEQNESIVLELWDYDFFSPNDHLGTFNMLINEKGGPYRTDLDLKESRNAKYTLEWEAH